MSKAKRKERGEDSVDRLVVRNETMYVRDKVGSADGPPLWGSEGSVLGPGQPGHHAVGHLGKLMAGP